MVEKGKHYKMIIFLIVYGPYKDIFDIFIEQFKKYWHDCPYPLIIGNEYYPIDEEDIKTIYFEDNVGGSQRLNKILEDYDADYFLGFEADRVIMDTVNTSEIEKILDFMEDNNIQYYRCHSSANRKRISDRYPGYDHYYHIRANEPYGVPGSSAIWSRQLRKELCDKNINGYAWEAYQNERAAKAKDLWIDGYATDDRNVFHILHCIEKQKWIRKAKHALEKAGFVISSSRLSQSFSESLISSIKDIFGFIPGKSRFRIKKVLKKIGFHFSTDY